MGPFVFLRHGLASPARVSYAAGMDERLKFEECDPKRAKVWLAAGALVMRAKKKQHEMLKGLKCLRKGCINPRARADEPGRVATDPLCTACKQRYYRQKRKDEAEAMKGAEARMVAAGHVPAPRRHVEEFAAGTGIARVNPRMPIVDVDAGGLHLVRDPGNGRKSAPRTEEGKRRSKR